MVCDMIELFIKVLTKIVFIFETISPHCSYTVLGQVMIAPIQLQCIFSYTILANPELEPRAPNTYQ